MKLFVLSMDIGLKEKLYSVHIAQV